MDRYDELENLISTIEVLEDEIKSEDILEDLRYLKYTYEDEKEELEKQLQEEQEKEEKEMNYQFGRSAI